MNKMNNPVGKYLPFPPIDLQDRTWPSNVITNAPIWCAVDLRDGNQAIHTPMTKERKKIFFEKLVEVGFKAIEVGFPAASQTDFDFVRMLIDNNMIPDDTAIQVLVQSREHLIERTFESLQGAKNVIIHLYNSTSPAQRQDVFGKTKEAIIDIALSGTELIKKYAQDFTGCSVQLEYSPENFSLTELDFALDISNAVIDCWNPSERGTMILNLPSTVESTTPNIYADQIEWISRRIHQRENVLVSLHAHNDRGTGVAATELGLLAGADRVEGTLFGNGERTGNTDISTVALNLYTQGVEPELDFSAIDAIREVYEECTGLPVDVRHPYVGELVYTAFSGSHQDAISKGLKARNRENRTVWNVPYLPIDPIDVGRSYEAIVRINSQSGKGGAAFILENNAGYLLPKPLQIQFSAYVQQQADELKRELDVKEVITIFTEEFLNRRERIILEELVMKKGKNCDAEKVQIDALLTIDGTTHEYSGHGDGTLNALTRLLNEKGLSFNVTSYDEHAMSEGSDAIAAAYIGITTVDGRSVFGVGTDSDISLASAAALISAVNRAFVLS